MPIKKLTEEYFLEIKDDLSWYRRRWTTDRRIAKKRGVSLKTVLQVKGCETYKEYQQINKAMHPPTKFSLADHVLALHRKEFEKYNTAYVEPLTAKGAVLELLNDKEQ